MPPNNGRAAVRLLVVCRTTKKGYEEVHVPALKPKPYEDGECNATAYYMHWLVKRKSGQLQCHLSADLQPLVTVRRRW
jgi:hypothetical protein